MPASLPVEIFDNLHELMNTYRERMRRALVAAHPELTFSEMRVLIRVGRMPGITQKELVEHSHTDKAQMARLLSHMQQQDLLQRSTSDHDKRVRCLHLSPRGKRLFTQLRMLQDSVASELLSGCSSPAQAQLLALIQQA